MDSMDLPTEEASPAAAVRRLAREAYALLKQPAPGREPIDRVLSDLRGVRSQLTGHAGPELARWLELLEHQVEGCRVMPGRPADGFEHEAPTFDVSGVGAA